MIAILLTPVYLLVNYYLLLWLYAWTGALSPVFQSAWFQVPATALYLFFALSPLTGMLVGKEPFHHALKAIGNYWIGMLSYVLLIVLVFDALRRITKLPFFQKYPYVSILHVPQKSLLIIGGFAVLLVLAVSLYGIVHARKLYVRSHEVVVQKECPLPSLKIALIADLHLGYNTTEKQVKRLVDELNAQSPDLVCIAGDLFDNEYAAIPEPDRLAALLAGIKSTYGTYACYGNHDVTEKILVGFTFPHSGRLDRDPRFAKFLDKANITMLEDETVLIANAFFLSGRKDPSMAQKEHDTRLSFDELTEGLDPDCPLIIMDHQPGEIPQAEAAGVDLLLSGHTHGGQMFPSNLLINRLWQNAWGVKTVGKMTSAVTSGAGVWGPAMRIGSDCEIMMLHLTFKPDSSSVSDPPQK